ncbi:hypothetical protein UMZ34_21945 [Halopseudomonas pachastrellae]|nr:hypothetical protein UMZ34_21945 [Halopseudomonas pachastrellae]
MFDDLASNTPEQLNFTVAFPVDGTPVPQAGYVTRQVPEQQVLSLDFDRTQHSVESAWRALYSAAYTQGLKLSKVDTLSSTIEAYVESAINWW